MSLKRTTIKDVASYCKMSVASVSLVLNNKPNRLSDQSKNLILEAAKELGYRPNQVAVSMVTKKTYTLGLIIPDISNTFFAEISRALEAVASSYGYTIIYGNTNDLVSGDIQYIHNFMDRGVDGIILATASENHFENSTTLINLIENSSIPIILIDRPIENVLIKSVLLDHYHGAYIAVKHLLELGHRHIGCLTGPLHLRSTRDKIKGYEKALSEYDIPFNLEYLYEGDFRPTNDCTVLPYFLDKKVTAIFAHNDLMALNLYKQTKDFHVSIPNDLSIIGFDNIFLGDFLDVPLTSISQPINEMAKVTIEEILRSIEGDTSPQVFTFTPTLKVKSSTTIIN